MFKDETGQIVPAIVSEEIWDRANEILKRRSDDVKSRQGICNHANLMTGKLYCTHCGAAYYRRESKDKEGNVNSKWVCSNKINNGADACPSFPLYEREIKPILYEIFNETKADVEGLLKSYCEMFQTLQSDDENTKLLESLKTSVELAEKKKMKLLNLLVAEQITDANFKTLTDQCDREISDATEEIEELKRQMFSSEEFRKHMEEIRRRLDLAVKEASNGLITTEFVSQYIDKIFATVTGENTVNLEVKIFTGKTTETWLNKAEGRYKGRTGHTLKKMIENYENNIK
jgi:hypothetical protein